MPERHTAVMPIPEAVPVEAQQASAAPHYYRIAAMLAAIGTVASVLEGCSSTHHTPPPDLCTDGGHQLIQLSGATWSALADELSYGSKTLARNYDISATSLALANPSIAVYKDGKLQDGVNYKGGKGCATLPGPGVFGLDRSDGKTEVGTYAKENYDTMADLLAMNTDLSGNPKQILPAGRLLRVGKSLDMNLFMHKMTATNIYEASHGNGALAKEIRDANEAIIDNGGALVKDTHAYLPPLKPNNPRITVQGIREAYSASYAKVGATEVIVPSEQKAVTQETPAMALQEFQLIRAGVPAQYAKLYVQYGTLNGVSPFLLTGQGKEESGWQANPGESSKGALGISQFMPKTWAEWSRRLGFPADASPLDPRYAIPAQAAYMKFLLGVVKPYAGKNSAEELALAAYNLGPGEVIKYRGMPPASEIGNYVTNITAIASRIQPLFTKHTPGSALHETSTGQIVPESLGKVVYFSQTDKRWTWLPYNTGTNPNFNIGLNGCAPTTQAMILSTLTDHTFTPEDMAVYNMAKGYVVPDVVDGQPAGGSDGHAAIHGMATEFGLTAADLGKSFGQIKQVIDAGGLVAIIGQDTDPTTPATPGGHVFLVRGYTKNGKLLIADPDSIANSQAVWDPAKILKSASSVIGVTVGAAAQKKQS